MGEVFGAHLVEELPELLDLLLVLVLLEEHPGLLEHVLVGEDRHRVAVADGEGDGVGRPGRDAVGAAVTGELDLGEEGAVVELGDETWSTLVPRSSSTDLKRSWVMGRGVSVPWRA